MVLTRRRSAAAFGDYDIARHPAFVMRTPPPAAHGAHEAVTSRREIERDDYIPSRLDLGRRYDHLARRGLLRMCEPRHDVARRLLRRETRHEHEVRLPTHVPKGDALFTGGKHRVHLE